jgi:hypothetical protein
LNNPGGRSPPGLWEVWPFYRYIKKMDYHKRLINTLVWFVI